MTARQAMEQVMISLLNRSLLRQGVSGRVVSVSANWRQAMVEVRLASGKTSRVAVQSEVLLDPLAPGSGKLL